MALRRRRAPTACAEPTTGPHTLATPCPVLQWLVFGGCAFAGGSAHSRRHRLGASRLCRGAPALEPGGEPAAGERGAALPARAGAGHARPARLRRGRLQVTLLLEPQSTIAREAMDGLAGLQ